jgi:hypothetical protein
MIFVKSTIGNTKRWTKNAMKAIDLAAQDSIDISTKHGVKLIEKFAPRGVRSVNPLRKSGTRKVFRKLKEGIISINKDNMDIALINEFGTDRKFVPFRIAPLLKTWAEQKYWRYDPKMKGLWVGGPRSSLGKNNVFFKPTFDRLLVDVPMIVKEEINKKLTKLR